MGETYTDPEDHAPHLFCFFALSVIIFFTFLRKTKGRPSLIDGYIASRTWEFLVDPNSLARFMGLVRFIIYVLLCMPAITLIVWFIILLIMASRDEGSYITAIAVLLVGISVTTIMASVLNIKWQKYRINKYSIVLMIIGAVCFAAFQLVATFWEDPANYFSVAAIFLSANGIIFTIWIFFVVSKGGVSINAVIRNLDEGDEVENQDDEKNLDDIVNEQLNDDDYFITQKMVYALFTIPSSSSSYSFSAVSGGLQSIFTKPSFQKHRFAVGVVLYSICLLILGAFAITVYYGTDEQWMGLLISLLVIYTDVILFFYLNAGLSEGPFEGTLIALMSRFFLILFSGSTWFVGFCCLYIVLALILFDDILRKHIPLKEKKTESDNVPETVKRDITKTPEWVLMFSTIIFVIITLGVYFGDPVGVELTELEVHGDDYPLWLIGIATIVLMIIVFLLIATWRIWERKKRRLNDKVQYFIGFQAFDKYWIFICISGVVVILAGIIGFFATDSYDFLIICIFLPFIWAFFLTMYANWVRNDYEMLMDIKEANIKWLKIRNQEEKIMEKIEAYQNQLLDASEADPGKPVMQLMMDSSKGFEGLKNDVKDEAAENVAKGDRTIAHRSSGMADMKGLRDNLPELWVDWRDNHGFCSAFMRGKLMDTDYNVIIFGLLFLLADILMAVVNTVVTEDLTYGASIAVLIVVLALFLSPMIEHFSTGEHPGLIEITQLVLAFVINFGYGLLYYILEFDEDIDDDDTNRKLNVIFLTFFFPTVLVYGAAFYKWKSDVWEMGKFVAALLIAAQIFCIVMALVVGILVNWTWGGILFGIFAMAFLFVIVLIRYVTNNYYLPFFWKLFFFTLCVFIGAVGIIVGIFADGVGPFVGFSITYFSIVGFLMFYGLSVYIRDYRDRDIAPLFFSPWVFPIYKYDPKEEKIKNHNNVGVMMYSVLGMTLVWSVLCVVWLEPVYIGIGIGSLCCLLIILSTIYIAGISPIQLGFALRNVENNPKSIKKAWLEAKQKYLQHRGAKYHDDFANFRDRNTKLKQLRAMIKDKLAGKDYTIQNEGENKAWNDRTTDLADLRQMYAELYAEEKRATKQYMHELKLVIHFQILLVVHAVSGKAKEVMQLNNFLSAKKVELRSFGIDLSPSSPGLNIFDKYQDSLAQINKLDPTQRYRFEVLKEQYIQEEEQKKKEREEQARLEEEALKKRKEEMEKQLAARHEKRARMNTMDMSTIPIGEMVDCPEKYDRIVAECKANNTKWTDTEWPANETSLGEHVKSRVVEWRRPGPECCLYEGGVTPEDIRQGALGDCYFLSAMTVLKQDRVENLFVGCKPDPKIGAYCIRFYKNDSEEYVIVDDNFPVGQDGNWAFAKSTEVTEIWPSVIEKAYAKLHGSYENIAAGKVQYALSDLTGGAPEEIKLEPAQNNPSPFWEKMLGFYQSGYLLGAGSPSNERGDSAVSQEGIVQGHAYAVLQVVELDGERLIQLRNPHGPHGVEWQGDWKDGDFKWTKKFKTALKYQEKDDGIFWMSLDDFVYEFANLYIARLFDPSKWTELTLQNGRWEGDTAAGLPCRANPKAQFSNNPQFIVTLTKPCTIFARLTQKETKNMFAGKNGIIWMAFPQATRVTEFGEMLGSSGSLSDLITVSGEFKVNAAKSPYKFNIFCAAMAAGPEGDGTFSLAVYSTDEKATISPLS